ncbi:hypothetical protein L208DRAFT_1318508 [Tricholoma matsutake]|nr:hypothetical protein L208DRAFT_1318508 [Tricholoma matsutake 945]
MTIPSTTTSITPLATDITHPSVAMRLVREGHWNDHAFLDHATNNWGTWHKQMILVFQMSGGLDCYLSGVHAYIQSKCAPSEVMLIEDCKMAKDAWSILSLCHKMQGLILQVTMIQEAFSVRYSPSVPFTDITTKLRDLNKRIWDMGALTSDSFLIILMLLALSSPDLANVHDSVINGISSATTASPYTASNIVARLDLKQTICATEATNSIPVPNEAHAAHSQHHDTKSDDFCDNCHKPCHMSEFCVCPGGGMAGKMVAEAQAARRAKCSGNNKSAAKP